VSDPEERFVILANALTAGGVRYVLMGVSAVNLYARGSGSIFTTQDYDLFLPPDADNELAAWRACVDAGLELWSGDEPLGRPLDATLAGAVVARRALVRAEDEDLAVDLSLVMAGFEFEDVWQERRAFRVGGAEVPVARLAQIVQSKATAARPKDQLFLATHEDALKQIARRTRARRRP
jgi:hypothetical protein